MIYKSPNHQASNRVTRIFTLVADVLGLSTIWEQWFL